MTTLRSLSTLSLLVALALPAHAAPGDDAKEMRRILHLANGQTIRVACRAVEGEGWEYKSKGEWRTLPRAMVAQVELESDAQALFGKARDAAQLKDPLARVALASLAFDHGLVSEGLEQLDFVLQADPDSHGARELLSRRWLLTVPSLEVPAQQLGKAKEELLRFGASAPAGAREIAVNELRKLPADETLRAELEKELRSGVVNRRSFATLALRRLLPGKSVKPLLMHAVLDPAEEVRVGAALALKALNEPGVIVPVVRALDSRHARVRENAEQVLGVMGYAAAVEPLMARLAAVASAPAGDAGDRLQHSHIFVGSQVAYVQDFDVEVATFQAVADPVVNTLIEGQATDVAVTGELVVTSVTESVTLRRSLSQLVGQEVGSSNRAWLDWWEKNKGKWMASERSQPSTGTDG